MFSILLYFVTVIPLILLLFYALLYVRRYRHPLKNAPGQEAGLVFGTIKNFLSKNCAMFNYYEEQRQMYGSVRKNFLPLGTIGMEISDPEWFKYVLITNGSNWVNGQFVGSGFFKQAVGDNGLVVVNGEQHKKYKKILSPAYKLSTLKKSMPIVQLCGERMVKLFNDFCRMNTIASGEFAGSSEIDVKYLFNKTTLDIAVLFLLGYDLQESCSWKVDTFGHYLWDVLEMQDNVFAWLSIFSVSSSFLRAIRNFSRFLPYGGNWRARTTNKMHDIIESIIETKIVELQRKQTLEGDKENPFRPLLNYMMDDKTSGIILSREEIHDLIMTFIIGGHETASISLMFTLYELCKKPEYETRLRNEVINVFEENDQKIDWDDITKKFPFLNAVVKESLRMYPPVPRLPRTSIKPDIIDGHYVPENTLVLLLTSELHRNPDIWPDPGEFKPERFLEPDDTIPWNAWLPFGEGFHKCIGYQFGLIEVSYLLALFIKNFRFSIDPKIHYHEFAFVSLNSAPTMKFYITSL